MRWVYLLTGLAMVIGFVVLARWVVGRLPEQARRTIGGLPVLGFILVPQTEGKTPGTLETGSGLATN